MAEKAENRIVNDEIVELRQRLEEAEDTLRAISNGEVDALVVDSPDGEVIYTLSTADYPYRLMIDEMNQGAVSVSPDSIILYSNRNFAGMLGINGTSVSGTQFGEYVAPGMCEQFEKDLQEARYQGRPSRICAQTQDRQRSTGTNLFRKTTAPNQFDQYCRH
jgi:PAS domain S-box-containing protein